MKTIGLLGGITCESSLVYYQLINELVRARLGGHNSARSVMVSVNFADVQPLTERGDWAGVLAVLQKAAKGIEAAGADLLVLCANTAHKLADEIGRGVAIPIVHIVDATAEEIRRTGLRKVGLLGTRFTMEEEFFSGRLRERHGIEALVPGPEERRLVHRIIIDELALGTVDPRSGEAVWRIIDSLVARGAQAIILGCTELPLLVRQDQGAVPLFDTTAIHARAAVDLALR
ncbi:MAG TPA: aspartate/glutamate racemase family protein [Candidatus Aminicenantes bacterium]|nr:aspartate/glutamate racemase family protein [Candidatus Aminicenantes bacterium]